MSHSALRQAIVDGRIDQARALARAALSDAHAAIEAASAGIREVGELWEEGEYFLPELVQGAEAMKAAMEVLQPALAAGEGPAEPAGIVVIGTVQGDLHDIGKTLVATLLQAHGFEVHDLGADVPVARFVAEARRTGAHIVAASALLTTTMGVHARLAEALAGTPARLLVGGAPTTPEWAARLGAAHADSAQSAVTAARSLLP